MQDHKWLALAPSFLRRKFTGRHLLQAVAGNAGWLVADKLIRLGLGLIVGVWIARYLGPSRFGLLNFAIAFVALFSTASNLGLQGVIVRDLVTVADRRESLLGSALGLRFIGSALAVVLAAGTIGLMRPNDRESVQIVWIVALMLLPQAWDVIEFDYQARVNARPIVIIRGLSFLISSAVKVLLIVLGATLAAFAWVTTGEIVLSAVLISAYARRQGTLPRLTSATLTELRYLLRTGWPLMITSLSVVLYWRIDQVMLGQMAGDAAVGLFSAAVRISEVWYFIPIALSNSAAPALTAIFQRSHTEFLEKLATFIRLMAAIGIAVAVIFTLFAKPIVVALYGPAYLRSSTILAIHGWAGIFVAVGVVSANWFINTGRFNYLMYQTLAGAVCNIGLNLFLIPRYAGVGAAMATVVSQIVSTMLMNALAAKTHELFFVQLRGFFPRWSAKPG